MMNVTRVLPVACIALASLALRPDASRACGPWIPTIVFVRSVGPDTSLARYLEGAVGLVDGGYSTGELAIAYRHFVGSGIDADERAGILERHARPPFEPDDRDAPWLAARARVVATPVERLAFGFTDENYEFVDNCARDAFAKAAATLDARIASAGAGAPEVRRFVEAQDRVFTACGREHESSLDDPPPGATPRERDDRAYQQAALAFYAGHYDVALERFEAIAANPLSEWRHAARYVVARVHQRLSRDEARRMVELELAARTLDGILADPAMSGWHDAARSYRDFVHARLDPAARAAEISVAVAAAHQGPALAALLADLETLTDASTFAHVPESDRLGVFVDTLRHPTDAAARRATALHHRTGSPAFLVAALASMRSLEVVSRADADALVAAAAALPSSHPAYVSAVVHRARLLLERDATDRRQLRRDLLAARTAIGSSRGPSASHALTLLAFAAADGVDDAIATAGAEGTVDEETEGVGDPFEPTAEVTSLGFDFHAHGKRLLDRLPPSEWVRFARGTSLADEARDELATVAYARALLTNDDATRRALSPMVARQFPARARDFEAVESARSPVDRRYARIWLLVHASGMRVDLDERARFEDEGFTSSASYFCPTTPSLDAEGSLARTLAATLDRNEARLVGAARSGSRAAVAALPPAGIFLAREAVAVATARPRDARNPELLARAVRATRWACSGPGGRAASRDAFRLLHAQYPDSEAAQRTQYFYGDR